MKPFQEVMAEHQARLARVAERGSVDRLRLLYEQAQAVLTDRLRQQVDQGLGDSFSAHQYRAFMTQIQHGQLQLTQAMTSQLGLSSREAQVESLRGLIADVTRLERTYRGAETVLPIEEASHFFRVIDQRRPMLLEIHAGSMRRYGSALVQDMGEQLGLSLAAGEAPHQAIDRVQQVAQTSWWKAERIARTETALAFNVTHADGIADTAREIPEMMQRWSEHVDDFTGAPLDSRVGYDSLALHGQVAPAGGMFTMPPDSRVSTNMWGRRFAYPPNRPNDRSVLSPWRRGWGIPAWRWDGSRRVPMND